jgi:hypothetical protein
MVDNLNYDKAILREQILAHRKELALVRRVLLALKSEYAIGSLAHRTCVRLLKEMKQR